LAVSLPFSLSRLADEAQVGPFEPNGGIRVARTLRGIGSWPLAATPE